MQDFLDYIGLVIKGLGVAIKIPFEIFANTFTVASIMPTFLGTVVVLICCVGIAKLIVGWL